MTEGSRRVGEVGTAGTVRQESAGVFRLVSTVRKLEWDGVGENASKERVLRSSTRSFESQSLSPQRAVAFIQELSLPSCCMANGLCQWYVVHTPGKMTESEKYTWKRKEHPPIHIHTTTTTTSPPPTHRRNSTFILPPPTPNERGGGERIKDHLRERLLETETCSLLCLSVKTTTVQKL